MSGKIAEEEYYDDEFEDYSEGPSPVKSQPAPAVEASPAAAAAAASSTPAPASSHTTQLFAGHSNAQQWEDVDFADVILGKKLGGGGFAIVYTGTWRGKSVALKTLVSYETSITSSLCAQSGDPTRSLYSLTQLLMMRSKPSSWTSYML